jgi:hypothetical protein
MGRFFQHRPGLEPQLMDRGARSFRIVLFGGAADAQDLPTCSFDST